MSGYKIYFREVVYLILITLFVFFVPKLAWSFLGGFFSSSGNVNKVAEIDLNNYVDVPIEDGADDINIAKNVFKVDDNILIHTSGRLLAFNKEGKNIWSRDIRAELAEIVKWNDSTIVADKFRGDFVVINSQNEIIKSVKNVGRIDAIKVSNDKVFVKILDENRIDVYDAELKKVSTIDDDYGSVIKFIVDSETSELIFYTISMNENKLKSFLYVYSADSVLIGSSDLESSLVFDMFIDDNINVICDDRILTFTKTAEPISEFLYAGYVDMVRAKGSSLYGIFAKGASVDYKRKLKKFNANLEEKKSVDIQNTSKGVELIDDNILIYGENKISILNYSLKVENVVNTSISINKLKWISDNYFYITDNKKVIIYKVD